MYQYPYYHLSMEQFQKALQEQAERLQELEKAMEEMRQEIRQMNKTKPVHIDKVEYRFDQLKVETLEGTLNIGFTPQETAGEIEDISLNEQGKGGEFAIHTPAQTDIYSRIRRQIYQYLDEQAPEEIRQLEEEHSTVLGQTYREQMIFDLRKQVDKRIGYYLSQQTVTSDNEHEIEGEIYEQTKVDVLEALERHMKQLKGEAAE